MRFLKLLPFFLILTPICHASFHIKDGQLVDGDGEPFLIRGINYPHTWFHLFMDQAIPDIASTGSNTVRLVLGSGDFPGWHGVDKQELSQLLQICRENDLIAIVEVHDATGFGDREGSVTMDKAVEFWLEMKDILMGQENLIMINIANEPLGNNASKDDWVNVHVKAIKELRAAGFTHTLIVDAPNWGQDWRKTALTRSDEVLEADPLGNTMISIHMYDVFHDPAYVRKYLKTFHDKGWPLLVGEFAADHGPGTDIAEDAILQGCHEFDIGYLGWSWSGNGGDLYDLDVVHNFDPYRLTEWGDKLINSPYGIRATSKPARIFTEAKSLNVSEHNVEVGAISEVVHVGVDTQVTWIMSKTQDWVDVRPAIGSSPRILSLVFEENTTGEDRTASIYLVGGGITEEIKVLQRAGE